MYESQIWGQIENSTVKRIIRLQNKALRVINFAHFYASSDIFYKNSKILKFSDNIKLLNLFFIYDNLRSKLPLVLNKILKLTYRSINYNTRNSDKRLTLPKVKTTIYGLNSIEYKCISLWNRLVSAFPNRNFELISKNALKKMLNNLLNV